MSIWSFLKSFGSLIYKAFNIANGRGLTDDILNIAYKWVKEAADKALTNAEKRAFVVKLLTNQGVPESIARLAVELAVQMLKKELNDLG